MFRHPSVPWLAAAAAFVLGGHYASVLAQESGRVAAQQPTYYYGHYDPDTVARAPKPVKKPAVSPAPVPGIVPLPPTSASPPGRRPVFPNQDGSPSRKPANVSPDEQGPTALRRPPLITQPAAIKPSGAKDSGPLFSRPEGMKAESSAAQPASPSVSKQSKAGSPRSMFVTTAPAQDRTAAPAVAGPSPGLTALPNVNQAQPAPIQPIAAPASRYSMAWFPKSMFSKYLPWESQTPVPTSATHSSSAIAQSRLVDAKPVDANSVSQPSAQHTQPLVPKSLFIEAGVAESQPAPPTMADRFPSPRVLPKVITFESADSWNAASIVSEQPRGLVALPRFTKAKLGEDKIAALHPLPQGPPTRVVPEVAPHPAVPTTSQGIERAENRGQALAPGSQPMIVVVEPTKQRSPEGVDASAKQPSSTTATLGERIPSEKALPESSTPKTVADSASPQRQPEVVAAPVKNMVPVTPSAPMQQPTASASASVKQDSNLAIASAKKQPSKGLTSPAKKPPTSVGSVFPKLLKVADSAQAKRHAKVAAVAPAQQHGKIVETSSKKPNSNTTSAPIERPKVAESKPCQPQAAPAVEMPVEPPPTIAATEKDELKLPLRPNPVRSRQTYLVSKYAASIAAAPAAAPRRPKESQTPLASVPLKSEKPPRANPVRDMDRLSDAGRVNPLR